MPFLKQEEQLTLVTQLSHNVCPFDLVSWVVVVAFADVLGSPHGPQISPVEADKLLLFVSEVKACAGPDGSQFTTIFFMSKLEN